MMNLKVSIGSKKNFVHVQYKAEAGKQKMIDYLSLHSLNENAPCWFFVSFQNGVQHNVQIRMMYCVVERRGDIAKQKKRTWKLDWLACFDASPSPMLCVECGGVLLIQQEKDIFTWLNT